MASSTTADFDTDFVSWFAGAEQRIATLADLDLVLEDGEAALGAHAQKLFGQLESDGYDRATVEQALDQAGAAPAAVDTAHMATVRMQRSGQMV